jgi:hypothetical protein
VAISAGQGMKLALRMKLTTSSPITGDVTTDHAIVLSLIGRSGRTLFRVELQPGRHHVVVR